MAVSVFSPEWAAQFKDEINRSASYKAAAKGWKWTIGFVVEAEPDKKVPEPVGVVLDIFDGEARSVTVGSAADAQKCNFVITASYSRWKQVINKQLDAIRGMLTGKLKLKGDLPTIVRYTKAAQELTECATRVPVDWPDEH
jgi:putative sterol carrier protein